MLGSISQHSLHGFSLQLGDRHTPAASLFPFFDDQGRTHALMFTSDHDGRITLIDFQPRLFAGRWLLPRLRTQRLDVAYSDLRDSELTDARNLAHLWHFDPWWELAAERYQVHPAVRTLKETNIPGFDSSISRVWFDKTLGRVTWIGFGEGESMSVKRFRPELLAAAARARGELPADNTATGEHFDGWRIRPFWKR